MKKAKIISEPKEIAMRHYCDSCGTSVGQFDEKCGNCGLEFARTEKEGKLLLMRRKEGLEDSISTQKAFAVVAIIFIGLIAGAAIIKGELNYIPLLIIPFFLLGFLIIRRISGCKKELKATEEKLKKA